MKKYIGIDIGGTKCAVVLGDREGNILRKVRFETTDVHTTLARILSETQAMQKHASNEAAAVGTGRV